MDRSLRILRDLGGVEWDDGLVLLDQTGGSVKLALLMASSGLASSEAMELLQTHDCQLRQALASQVLELAQS